MGGTEGAMTWTLEEAGVWIDGEGGVTGWAVIDEDGEQIEFFREREDAEEWLQERMAAAEMQAREDEWTYQQEVRL